MKVKSGRPVRARTAEPGRFSRPALANAFSDEISNPRRGFPLLDLQLTPASVQQRLTHLLVDQFPRPASRQGMRTIVLGKASGQIVGRANVKLARRSALKNVNPGHEGNGRPVRARTADLHRVNCVVRKLNLFACFAFPVRAIAKMPLSDRVLVTSFATGRLSRRDRNRASDFLFATHRSLL